MNEIAYPKTANTELVNADTVRAYLARLFAYVDFEESHFLSLRQYGEKGTPQEGVKVNTLYVQPAADDVTDWTVKTARRCAQHDLACFIIPAVLKTANGDAAAIGLFTSVLIDIDSGNTHEKRAFLEGAIGPASMVVRSGGRTDTGHEKLHLYWLLKEPTDAVDRVARVRLMLAERGGGDRSIGRAHQPIRVPGSVNCKRGGAVAVTLETTDHEYELAELEEKIAEMGYAPGVEPPAAPALPFGVGPSASGGAFSVMGDAAKPGIERALTETVAEGGAEDRNRWSEFTRVAGHWIATAGQGACTIEEAYQRTAGWALSNMSPPWPEQRLQSEFKALVAVHIKNHGAIQPPAPVMVHPIEAAARDDLGLLKWTTNRIPTGEPPRQRFIAKSLIPIGAPSILIADGSVGKTQLALDLAVKMATRKPGEELTWLGEPLSDDALGGRAIVLTAEDDENDIWRRLHGLFPCGRYRSNDRVIILPMIAAGGAFPFVVTGQNRKPIPSNELLGLLEAMQRIPDVRLVIVDPIAPFMHDDENAAHIVNAFYQAVTPAVCKRMGAALLFTHHIRKTEEIESVDDMKGAARGSGAIINNVRQAVGVWRAPHYAKALRLLGEPVKRNKLFRAAVLKSNAPDTFDEIKTLVRREHGAIEDVTFQVKKVFEGQDEEARAWLVFAVKKAAEANRPFSRTDKNGLFERRHDLPPTLANLPREKLRALADDCLARALISKHSRGYLDVPGGNYSTQEKAYIDATPWQNKPDWTLFRFDATVSGIAEI